MLVIAAYKTESKRIRILASLSSLFIAACIGSLIGVLYNLQTNLTFTKAADRFIQASTELIKGNEEEKLIEEWNQVREEFHPTYENQGNFTEIVTASALRMETHIEKKRPNQAGDDNSE